MQFGCSCSLILVGFGWCVCCVVFMCVDLLIYVYSVTALVFVDSVV